MTDKEAKKAAKKAKKEAKKAEKAKKKAGKKGIVKEFKEFISRGNVIDLAVGVIIGGAFTAIVNALTGQILQPVINYLISLGGGGSLESARTILGETVYTYVTDPITSEVTAKIDWSKTNYIDWGAFISAIINFILIAIILFTFVKIVNSARSKQEEIKARIAEAEEAKKQANLKKGMEDGKKIQEAAEKQKALQEAAAKKAK